MLIKIYTFSLFSQHLHKVIIYLCLLPSFLSHSVGFFLLFLPGPGAHSVLLMIIPFYLKSVSKVSAFFFKVFVATCNLPYFLPNILVFMIFSNSG